MARRGRRYHLTIGQYDDGRPGEVFVHGATVGSDVDGLCGDVAVLISRLLQFGDDPASLASGIGRLGNGDPASIVGAIADVVADLLDCWTRERGWPRSATTPRRRASAQ